MRTFQLHRDVDESGISGTGVVAEGVHFTNDKVAITWLTQYTSVAIYDSMETVEAIHGHGGKTRIVWLPEAQPILGRTTRPQRYARCLKCGSTTTPAESMRCTSCKSGELTEDP